MFDWKKLGCLGWFISVFTLLIWLLVGVSVGISSKSNGVVVVLYINVGGFLVWTQNTISGLEATDLDTDWVYACFPLASWSTASPCLFCQGNPSWHQSIMLTRPENQSDPLASSVGWVFDFDNKHVSLDYFFKQFRIHEHY